MGRPRRDSDCVSGSVHRATYCTVMLLRLPLPAGAGWPTNDQADCLATYMALSLTLAIKWVVAGPEKDSFASLFDGILQSFLAAMPSARPGPPGGPGHCLNRAGAQGCATLAAGPESARI